MDLPKSLLDALDVVFGPVTLGNVFLANGHAFPSNSHHGNMVNIILVKLDLKLGKVAGGPLAQAPALNKLLGRLKCEVLARDVSAKQLKLAALFGTLEDLGRRSGEGGNPRRVDKGLVQLFGGRSELFVIGNSGSVDCASGLGLGALAGRLGGGATRVDLGG